jgi:uncharacterized protein YkwD
MKKAARNILLSILLLFVLVKPVYADNNNSNMSYFADIKLLIQQIGEKFRDLVIQIKVPDEVLIPRPSPNPKLSNSLTPIFTQTISSIPEISISPSVTKTFTISQGPFPKATLTVSPQPTTTPLPTITPLPSNGPLTQVSDPTDFLLAEINTYRQSLGLSNVEEDRDSCSFATVRAREIFNNFSHEDFNKRIEDKSLPYISYTLVTENIAYNSDYTKVVTEWIASPGHAENLRQDTRYACIGKFDNYYTYESYNL